MYNFDGYDLLQKNYTQKEIKSLYTHLRKSIKRINSRKKMYNALQKISNDLNHLNRTGLHYLDQELVDVKMLNDEALYKKLDYKKIQKTLRQTIPPTKNKSEMLHNVKNLMTLFDFWLEDGNFSKTVEFVESDTEVSMSSNDNIESLEEVSNENFEMVSIENSPEPIDSSQNESKNQPFQTDFFDNVSNENSVELSMDLNEPKNQSFEDDTENENSVSDIEESDMQTFNINEYPDMKDKYPQNSDSEEQNFIDKYIYDKYGSEPSGNGSEEESEQIE